MAHLTDADATVIVGLAGAFVAYLGPRRARVKRAAREQTAAELEEVIAEYKRRLAEHDGDTAPHPEGDSPV